MYFEINVSKNGTHFFATHRRSITSEEKAVEILNTFQDKFPEDEGYELMITYNPEVHTYTMIAERLAVPKIINLIKSLRS